MDAMRTRHTLGSVYMASPNFASPMLLIGFAVALITFVKRNFPSFLFKSGFTISSTQIEVDEDLPNFFDVVKLADADWVIEENQNLRDIYGFSFVPYEVEKRLGVK